MILLVVGEEMRDPKRIDEMTTLLSEIWKLKPDLRLFQLIYILQDSYSDQSAGLGRIVLKEKDGFERIGYNLFSLEDDAAALLLRDCLEKFKKS